MGYMRIKCHYCGGTWEVYGRSITGVSGVTISGNYPRTCPHCFKAIEKQTWDKQIIPAFLALDDANRELVKDSSGYHTPLFEVSYEADTVFRNVYGSCPNID